MRNGVEKHASLFAESMIEALKKGTAPWQRPWRGAKAIYPHNFKTGHRYCGSNLLLLLAMEARHGYGDSRWGGFGQIRNAGGHVKKGQHGVPILIIKGSRGETVETINGSGRMVEEKQGGRMYVSVQYVFNVEQTEGLTLPAVVTAKPEWNPQQAVEAVAHDAHIRIVERQGGQAAYDPTNDLIKMPARHQFDSADQYYLTLLHELGHSTSHASRLNRDVPHDRKNTLEYAIEELRAEMAAMMSGARLEIGHNPRHGESYVAFWLDAAGNDPNYIRNAARDAQAISTWLLRNHAQGAAERSDGLKSAA